MYEINFKIIKVGTSIIDPGNIFSKQLAKIKLDAGIGGGSSVTVVFDKNKSLLIDTGFDDESNFLDNNINSNKRALLNILAKSNLKPCNIDKVFITHAHRDHYGNINVFEKAAWYCLESCIDLFPPYIKSLFIPVKDGEEIMKNVFIMHTSGHTKHHASVIIKNKNNTVSAAVAGDAIINLQWLMSKNIYNWNSDFFDKKKYISNQIKLLNEVDYIIPGHGQPFYTSCVRNNINGIKIY